MKEALQDSLDGRLSDQVVWQAGYDRIDNTVTQILAGAHVNASGIPAALLVFQAALQLGAQRIQRLAAAFSALLQRISLPEQGQCRLCQACGMVG